MLRGGRPGDTQAPAAPCRRCQKHRGSSYDVSKQIDDDDRVDAPTAARRRRQSSQTVVRPLARSIQGTLGAGNPRMRSNDMSNQVDNAVALDVRKSTDATPLEAPKDSGAVSMRMGGKHSEPERCKPSGIATLITRSSRAVRLDGNASYRSLYDVDISPLPLHHRVVRPPPVTRRVPQPPHHPYAAIQRTPTASKSRHDAQGQYCPHRVPPQCKGDPNRVPYYPAMQGSMPR